MARVERLLREARRLAIDLEVDRDTITEAWFVAAAFPPASRRPALPWATYLLLRFHPERHDLVDRAAAAGWNQARRPRSWRYSLEPRTSSAWLRPSSSWERCCPSWMRPCPKAGHEVCSARAGSSWSSPPSR